MTTKFHPIKALSEYDGSAGDGFVEFDFAIGDPARYVELILPEPAFQEFAKQHGKASDEARREGEPQSSHRHQSDPMRIRSYAN